MAASDSDLVISISTDVATIRRSLKKVVGDVEASSSAIGRSFDRAGKSMEKSVVTSTTAIQRHINNMVGIADDASRQWKGVLANQGDELDRLRAKFNPLFATIDAYRKSVADIRRANAIGAISVDEMANAISRERRAALSSMTAIKARQNALRGQDAAAAAASAASYANELDRLRSKFDPLYSSMKRHRAALEEISKAERMGAISASAAIDAHTREVASYQAQIAKLNELSFAKKSAAQGIVDKATIIPNRAADIAAYGAELDRLRAKFNPLFAAQQKYLSELREIKTAHAVGAINASEMAAAIQRTKNAYDGTVGSIRAVKNQASQATQIFRANRFEAGNLAAQFNDIGVQLAGGQSPFLIALQQGTQINQVLGGSGGGLRGTIGLLGGAFASLLNPVSLATIGIIGLGGVAVQYFTQLLSDGEESAKVLKEQADLIQKVADKWGEAYPAIKAYAEEQKKIAEDADLDKATKITVGASFSGIRSDLDDIAQAFRDAGNEVLTFGISLEEVRNAEPALSAASGAIDDLEKKMREGTDTTDDFDRVITEITALLNNAFVQATDKAEGRLSRFLTLLNRARTAALNRNFEKAVDAGAMQLPTLDPLGFIDTIRDQNNRANATKSQYQIEREALEKKSHRGGGKSDAEKQAEAIKRVTENLRFEGEQLTRTAEEQQVYNQLKAAGVDINTEAGQTIAELVRHNYELDEAQKAAKKSQEDFANGIQQLESDAVDALGQVIAGTEDAGDAFKKLAIEIVKSALTGKGAYADLFSSIFGGAKGGGGLLSMLFGGIGGGGSQLAIASNGGIGMYASGTSYAPGGMALVGERGPELIHLPRGSQVLPTTATMPALRRGGGATSISVNFAPVIDARGADREGLARVQMQLNRMQHEMPAVAVQAVQKAKAGRVKGL